MTFGSMLKFYEGMHKNLQNEISMAFSQQKAKKRQSKWFAPVPVDNKRVFASITLVLELLSVMAPKSGWKKRLLKLLESYPNIPLCEMGFPEDWKKTPFFVEVA